MNRILWADDEIELLKPYIIYLQDKGYEVITTNNGDDAVELCDKEHVDIVFLDENMPGLSGLETLSDIKLKHPALPVVMITKSEEENLMNQAIGEQIADYLIKPVNPSQILLCLKKHIHKKSIVEEHVGTGYREEFSDIGWLINSATTIAEWQAVLRTLTKWEMQLDAAGSGMREMLQMQRKEANAAFAKFVQKNYLSWVQGRSALQPGANQPLLSPDILKTRVFPMLDNGDKVCLVVIDNFRYDQWKIIEPEVSQMFNILSDDLYMSILPTATQYSRNAIFAGLMPEQIHEMFPQYWVEEGDEEGKNIYEEQLLSTLIQRYRRKEQPEYFKILEADFCEKVIGRIRGHRNPLTVIVINFIDMLSHSRTESKMMRELCADESAYRSLTLSWFRHSPTMRLFEWLARLDYKLVLTTDHGTVRVDNPVQIIGDKNTNTNLRYKVGKALACKSKDVFVMNDPKQYGLTTPNISSSYMYATSNDFFGYPNNFNYYAQYYTGTFQHGGISLEEMLCPLITLEPK
ncbi:MAG: bifunctional response regulator/alkaline phosphatase family protein [Paludibacteraceae bacterium]|nr:bifunctional response regulator/alkaline phosphatase family protein [Paludibacteraceae bacterium]